jgi:hypothetical protein
MWRCEQCGEVIDEIFDACWNCGTSAAGDCDAGFHPESEADVSNHTGFAHGSGIVTLAWRWFAAPPSARVPRWFTHCCTGVVLICVTCYIGALLHYVLVFAPALQESTREFDKRYPNSNLAGVGLLLGQAAYLHALIGVPMVMALFTVVTWRCHGVWTKFVGFSPFIFAAMIRLIDRIASCV